MSWGWGGTLQGRRRGGGFEGSEWGGGGCECGKAGLRLFGRLGWFFAGRLGGDVGESQNGDWF